MKGWQRKNIREFAKERVEAMSEGFEFFEHTPYHFKVTAPFSEISIDVFPSTRKMMQTGAAYTERYDNLVEGLRSIFAVGV